MLTRENEEMWLALDLEWYFSPPNYLLSLAAPKRNKYCQGLGGMHGGLHTYELRD